MCYECKQTIFPSSCPNADAPEYVCRCDECRGKLYVGDRVTIIKNFVFCEDCIWSYTQDLEKE